VLFDKRLVVVLFGVLFFGTCSTTVWAELNQWASYGPMGGSAFSISVDPQNPTTLYATSNGPVFKSAYAQALTFAGLGDKERTVDALERMATLGPVRLGRDLTYPEFDLVRGDPRLKALRKNVGLPE
jgi:hypothetical protein